MGKQVFTDTSDFFSIDAGDEIEAGGKRYRVTGYERERRFGIEDPKHLAPIGETRPLRLVAKGHI